MSFCLRVLGLMARAVLEHWPTPAPAPVLVGMGGPTPHKAFLHSWGRHMQNQSFLRQIHFRRVQRWVRGRLTHPLHRPGGVGWASKPHQAFPQPCRWFGFVAVETCPCCATFFSAKKENCTPVCRSLSLSWACWPCPQPLRRRGGPARQHWPGVHRRHVPAVQLLPGPHPWCLVDGVCAIGSHLRMADVFAMSSKVVSPPMPLPDKGML